MPPSTLTALPFTAPLAARNTAASATSSARTNSIITDLLGIENGVRSPDVYVNREECNEIMADLQRHGIVSNREVRLYGARAQIHEVLMTQMQCQYECSDGILAWVIDITDRKHAEMELGEAKEIAEEATRAKSDFWPICPTRSAHR